jgi:hypothetical protein
MTMRKSKRLNRPAGGRRQLLLFVPPWAEAAFGPGKAERVVEGLAAELDAEGIELIAVMRGDAERHGGAMPTANNFRVVSADQLAGRYAIPDEAVSSHGTAVLLDAWGRVDAEEPLPGPGSDMESLTNTLRQLVAKAPVQADDGWPDLDPRIPHVVGGRTWGSREVFLPR